MTKNEMLTNIFAKCVEINGMEAHTHRDNNKPNVFFNYSGHVSDIRIYYCINGWQKGVKSDGEIGFYIKDITDNVYNEIMDELNKLQEHINEVVLDCTMNNIDNLKKLKVGDVFMLTTPINSVCRGTVCTGGNKGKWYSVNGIKNGKGMTLAALKKYLEYLNDLKHGRA